MGLRSFARWSNAFAAELLGVRLVRTSALFPWQADPPSPGTIGAAALPELAPDYLRPDNPRLLALTSRYAAVDRRATAPAAWTPGKLSPDDLLNFRGDNAFMWQVRGRNANELCYALTYYHLKAGAAALLLSMVEEDGAFGAVTFEIDGRLVSRDLLDSVGEIQFLHTHAGLGTSSCSILDIGAGYGRLAHRIAETHPTSVRVFATDAVPASTFLCEYYLRFRGRPNAIAVPLDELDALLESARIDLAVNVHSFSECTAEAVAWWTERLAAHDVKRLMVVPNGATDRARLNGGQDMEAIFARYGYRLAVRAPRYDDRVVQEYGVDPAWLYLFERA